jgi:hypothetical protein
VRPQRRDYRGALIAPRRATIVRPDLPRAREPMSALDTAVARAGPLGIPVHTVQVTQEPPMTVVEQLASEHRERLERFRQQAERARETEVSRIAIDILGVAPDDVARALRGNLTEDD